MREGQLGFLGTWPGQVLLAAGSVLFLVLAKGLTRRPGDAKSDNRPFQWDDLAIGLDLLVLSLVTLVGYAGSQYRAEMIARSRHDPSAIALAQNHQADALRLAAFAFLLFVLVSWLIQWWGQYTREERTEWRKARFDAALAAGALNKLQARQTDATEVDLALEMREVPRFKVWWGHLVPTAVGLLILMFAIRAVTQ
jgi:hypothetical protein